MKILKDEHDGGDVKFCRIVRKPRMLLQVAEKLPSGRVLEEEKQPVIILKCRVQSYDERVRNREEDILFAHYMTKLLLLNHLFLQHYLQSVDLLRSYMPH